MVRNFSIIFLFWLGGLLSLESDYQTVYTAALAFLEAHQTAVVVYGTLGSVALVLVSLFLGQLSWFGQIYLLARLSFEVSQFIICLLSFAAVALWFDFRKMVWLDLGWKMSVIPFEVLTAACISLWIFDFNYPMQRRILRNLTVPALSALLIYCAAKFLS